MLTACTGGEDNVLKKYQVSEAWLPVVERKRILVLCCLSPPTAKISEG